MPLHHAPLPRWSWLLAFLLLAAVTVRAQSVPSATKEAPFVNSLGMRFVPIPRSKILVSVWETRAKDFRAFTDSIRATVANVPANDTRPAAGVSWEDADAFCQWLTLQERRAGKIGPKDQYRLPTDAEWDRAAGLERYPWGNKWPAISEWSKLPGYYPGSGDNLAPVGGSAPNRHGIYDLGGNAFEWVDDWYDHRMNSREIRTEYKRLEDDRGGRYFKTLRGASWVMFDPMNLLLEYRYPSPPKSRGPLYGFRCVLEFNAANPAPATVKTIKPLLAPPVLDARAKAGREIFGGRCRECHQLFDPASYPNDEWDDWMGKMSGKAKLTADERTLINQFLRTIRPATP